MLPLAALFAVLTTPRQGHADAVRTVLTEMLAAQCDVLLAPNVGRSRHLLTEGGASLLRLARPPHAADASPATPKGRRKRSRVQHYKAERHVRITLACTRLSAAVEEMKTAGLPGNEAARLRQYSQLLMGQWEIVRNVKRYRTPLTTRCFGRLANLMHPFIMGPYCACLHTSRLGAAADARAAQTPTSADSVWPRDGRAPTMPLQ